MKNNLKKVFPLFLLSVFLLNFFIWQQYLSKDISKGENLEFYMLDVGQGDGLYFRTPKGQDVVVDGGPGKDVLGELGKAMPFYDKYINMIIITHPHQDHIGGLISIIEKYDVGQVLMTGIMYKSDDYDELKALIRDKKIPIKIVKAGEKFSFSDNISLDILAPEAMDNKTIDNLNNSSIVAILDYKNFEILLSGDAEVEEWSPVLKKEFPEKIEILKAAHHGSSNGTSEKLLEKIKPQVALISAGKGNRYGHPHIETLKILEKFGVKIYRTDQSGTIKITSDGEKFDVKCQISCR